MCGKQPPLQAWHFGWRFIPLDLYKRSRANPSNEKRRFSRLRLEEAAIDAIRPGDEFRVASLLDDAAAVKHENAVEALHRREPMRHNDRGAPRGQMRDGIADQGFRYRVEA